MPSHHVRRARLTSSCLEERVVVVEAAGGYGKSVLAAELVDAAGVLPIWVLLEEGGVSVQLLAGRLRAAVARAGLTDAAGAMAAAGEDPAGAVDAMLGALAGEACAIVIDDAHHAQRDAALLIDRVASQLVSPQRLVVLARQLPRGLERLRRADALQLTAADLALTPDETVELCRSGFGLEISADEARLLVAATGGWTAAAVLAASRAKRTAQPLRDVTGTAGSHADPVDSILRETFAMLGADRELLAQIAPLPLIDRELLAVVTGENGFFDRALESGLPMTQADDGWWELPGPVRDRLGRLAPVDPARLRRAATYYEQRGQLGMALQLLLCTGHEEAAAELLEEADPLDVEAVDVLELLSVIDRIPVQVLDRYPRTMLHAALSCHAEALLERRAALLERLTQIVRADRLPEVRRAVDAELAIDIVSDGNEFAAAEALARRVLETASSAEQLTRARALVVLGRAAYWHRDASGQRRVPDMRRAADYLEQATDIYLSLGHRARAAGLAPYRAVWIEMGLGRPLVGLEIVNEALSLVIDRPRRFGYLLQYRAELLEELGRYDESEADHQEILRLARQLGNSDIMVAYVHWNLALSRSVRGDAEGTLSHVHECEKFAADWWDVAGGDFLADAADCLDRVGHTALAWEYLERARSMPGDAQAMIAMAELALLARNGDPERVEEQVPEVYRHGIAPREHWRITLLRAYAALRRGDEAARGLAARAFEEAARLGQPQLPMLRERELSEALLALAVETGLPAAQALQASALPVAIAVLGRFELTHGGRTVSIGSGQGAQLLKLVAVSGGKIHAERAIEVLWPEVEPAAGRNRLRTVLGRLRESAPEVVVREGDHLSLAPEVRLDLTQFDREAREAQSLAAGDPAGAVALARSAIARYRGDLLPHDPYADWTEEARDAARRTMLDLLDLCAEAAAERGDLDEARRMVERTIELAPYDDDRYLKAATILHEQGRKGAALSVLRRARSALAQIGIDPPGELVALEERIAVSGTESVTLV